MPNQIPIIGEPMSEWLKDAIDKRQEVYGSGVGTLRTPEELTYLNSRTSWIKMASSVDIKNSERTIQLEGLMGTDLAKKGVLFNGLSSDGKPKSGVAAKNSKINDSAYGFGGTEFGIQPMPISPK